MSVCPHILKLYKRISQIFGFGAVLPLTPKDVFVWKRFYKKGNERDLEKEIFFKMLNLSVHTEIGKIVNMVTYPLYPAWSILFVVPYLIFWYPTNTGELV